MHMIPEMASDSLRIEVSDKALLIDIKMENDERIEFKSENMVRQVKSSMSFALCHLLTRFFKRILPVVCITYFVFFLWKPKIFERSSDKEDRVDLTRVPWSFHSSNGSIHGSASVPGDIYADLFNNGIILDPMYGERDSEYKWIPRMNWTYETKFTLTSSWIKKSAVILNIRGLDTIATVTINNRFLIATRNQFRTYFVDLKGLWIVGENTLKIFFESPIEYTQKLDKQYKQAFHHGVPPACPPTVYNGECHVNLIRKIQSSFSWDWGPSFPTVGVWQPLYIEGIDSIFIEQISATVDKRNDNFVVFVDVIAYSALSFGTANVEIQIPELSISRSFVQNLTSEGIVHFIHEILLPVNNVILWWPNGYGKQFLYDLEASVMCNGEIFRAKSIKVGFRWIELNEEPDNTKKGRNFYFKINDHPIFLKGSNWIPLSPFPARNHSRRMNFLLDSAAEANLNSVRIWGGGRYEDDEFYEIADRNGILIWHDFMFACSMYSIKWHFSSEIEAEISTQVYKLRHHASILIWGGDNENAMGAAGSWFIRSDYSYKEMSKDYLAFLTRIKSTVELIDQSRPFVWSSPSNGANQTLEELLNDPNSDQFGDKHFYNEMNNLWLALSYPIPRCATEYGVQSVPGRRTMLHWINEDQWSYDSKSMISRQHKPGGIVSLLALVYQHFPLPPSCEHGQESRNIDTSCRNQIKGKMMDRFAYFAQMNQAITMQTESEHYRRWRGRFEESGRGNTMCAMIWQLNDIWAGYSWSSIDYGLVWKPLHYYIRRFFDKVIVSLYFELENNSPILRVYVVSDELYTLEQHNVTVSVYAFNNGFVPIYEISQVLDIPGQSSIPVPLDLKNIMKVGTGPEDIAIRAQLFTKDRKQVGFDAELLPDKLYKVNLANLGVVEVSGFTVIDEMNYRIELKANAVAPMVWLDFNANATGWFTDNAFTMFRSTRTVMLKLYTLEQKTLKKSDIIVCSLKNC